MSGSYYEDYLRSKAKTGHLTRAEAPYETQRLLTDRNAYISFLELQLERVSSACLHTQSLEKRVEEMHSIAHSNEQKLTQLTKVLTLSQQYAEENTQTAKEKMNKYAGQLQNHQEAMDKCWDAIKRLQDRLAITDSSIQESEARIKDTLETASSEKHHLLQATDDRISNLQSQIQHDRSNASELSASLNKLHQNLSHVETSTKDFIQKQLEHQTHQTLQTQLQFTQRLDDQHEKLEKFQSHLQKQYAIDMARVTCQVEQQEEQLQNMLANINQHQSQQHFHQQQLQKQQKETQQMVNQNLIALQDEIAAINSKRLSTVHSTPLVYESISSKPTNVETKNWERQFHQLQANVSAYEEGLEAFKDEVQQMNQQQLQLIREIRQRASKAEDTCTRIASDSIERAESQGTQLLEALEEIETRVHAELVTIMNKMKGMEKQQRELEKENKKFEHHVHDLELLSTNGAKEEGALSSLRSELCTQLKEFQDTIEAKVTQFLDQEIPTQMKALTQQRLEQIQQQFQVAIEKIDQFAEYFGTYTETLATLQPPPQQHALPQQQHIPPPPQQHPTPVSPSPEQIQYTPEASTSVAADILLYKPPPEKVQPKAKAKPKPKLEKKYFSTKPSINIQHIQITPSHKKPIKKLTKKSISALTKPTKCSRLKTISSSSKPPVKKVAKQRPSLLSRQSKLDKLYEQVAALEKQLHN